MKKLICAIMAVVMVVATCITMVACNTNDSQEVVGPIATVTDGEGNNISETTTAMPKRMVFAYTASADATAVAAANTVLTSTTLTATISPSNASNQKVDWSVEFVNPNSTWAKGKTVTDYVNAVPTEANGLSAKIECYQAFGEQIKVTVTSQDNTDAKASCVLDFVKRLTSVSCNLSAGSKLDLNTTVNLTYTLNYSDGTLTGSFTPRPIYIKLADALFTACKSAVTASNFVFVQDSPTSATISASNLSTSFALGSSTRWMNYTGGDPGNGYEQWQTAFYNYVSANPSATHAFIHMTYDYTYQGTASTTQTVTVPVSFTLSSCTISVSSLSVSSETVVL